MKHFTWS